MNEMKGQTGQAPTSPVTGRTGAGPLRQSASAASSQTWTAEGYDANARFVSDLGAEALAWLDPGPGERVLDLGCGDGELTAKIQQAGAQVLGVDVSDELLAAARARGLDVRLMDGEALDFRCEFDAVFSNAALHWMTQPQKVIEGVRRSLWPGGRFVAEFGGHGNVAAIVTALRALAVFHKGDTSLAGPWYFPTPRDYRTLLEQNGFFVERIGLFPRPTPLPTGMEPWLMTFRKPFFDQFQPNERQDVMRGAVKLLKPTLRDRQGQWWADYVRLRVEARLAAD